jgi:hypothetical protein
VTLPRVVGSREVRCGVGVYGQAGFRPSRAIRRVQSGRLRIADACELIGLRRRQVFRLLRDLTRIMREGWRM